MVTIEQIWQALEEVMDPEIPKVSVVDLGMIHEVKLADDGKATITMLPTFAGCPAIDYIKNDIRERVQQLPLQEVEVLVTFEIPWDSNRISAKGRELLKDSYLAPPPKHQGMIELDILSDVACPHCNSRNTTLQSPFGPTLCRSIHYCNNCLQAFEQFKPVA